MTSIRIPAASVFLAFLFGAGSGPADAAPVRNVVLVHGAFADGSGWRAVTRILERDGYRVSVVQDPVTTLAEDVAATRRVLGAQTGSAVLVGNSYGGAVITEAGTDPHVASLVYVAAFVPDEGETVAGLIKSDPGAQTSIVARDGFLSIDQAKFPRAFAADLPPEEARFMALSQVPEGIPTATTPIADPAWKHKPAWTVVASEDRMINPELERRMDARAHATTIEVGASHAVYVSQPAAVARLIGNAARNIGR